LKLAIVIVHFNTSRDLDRCLGSLAAYPPSCEHRVIVVDNASTEPGLDEVRRRFPDCLWILEEENTGYARGCNRGLAAAEAEYHLVLNPDIVAQPGALDALVAFADAHPRAGIVGPQLLNEDGSIQESCRRFYTFRTLLLRRTFLGRIFRDSRTVRLHLMKDFDHRTARPVDWVLGGCLLVRRSAMLRTGPMDERFFLYFEDVDWCYRMWQAGFEVQYAPDARFEHRHRRASAQGRFNRSFWLHLASLISFYEKWGMVVWLVKKWREPLLVFLLWALDMAALAGSFLLAYGARGLLGDLFPESLFPLAEYRPLLVFAWLLATATFLMTGRYRPDRIRRGRGAGEHLQQIGIVSVLLLASTYLGHMEVISRAVLLMFIPLFAATTALGAALFRRLRARLERGRLSLDRTLLCGPAREVGAWLQDAGDLTAQGVDVAGYLAEPAAGGGLPPLDAGRVPWLGLPGEILEVVTRYRISQVVFWDRPAAGEEGWRLLASLRRLRIRLRWQVEDVWLLAAGARADLFGGRLSAVRGTATGSALRLVGGRLLAVAAGLVLGVLGAAPWLVLKSVRRPRGTAAIRAVVATDLWGHDPRLRLAVDAEGRVLPLGWQWSLAPALLAGRVALTGPRMLTAGRRDAPRAPDSILEFWRREPRAPGLSGSWAAGGGGQAARVAAIIRQLWFDPGGFGILGTPEPASTAPEEEDDPT